MCDAQFPSRKGTLCAAGRDAGDTYSKLAEVHIKQDNKTDAAQAYVEASKAYQRVDKSSMQTTLPHAPNTTCIEALGS